MKRARQIALLPFVTE
ncbi:MAG: hypothetical protein MR622_07955 [Clostridiales bacterium]|nr:hypothetical protein [Clostridiales bacterium]